MNTLLLRLAGPLQSWGVQSRFGIRDTGLEPSKSAVVGLLCASLGRPRQAPIEDLAGLRMGVRADREGRLETDYHTAQDVLKAGGGLKNTELSRRYYLAGAVFLVGLESDDWDLLKMLQPALQRPVWPIYLGCKAFVPACPVWLVDGLRQGMTLESALQSYPLLVTPEDDQPSKRVRLVLEDPQGEEIRPDWPISFADRRFAPRRVRTIFNPLPPIPQEVDPCTSPA